MASRAPPKVPSKVPPTVPPATAQQTGTTATIANVASTSSAAAALGTSGATTKPKTPRGLTLAEKQKYMEQFHFPYCDESLKYEKIAKIGQGSFGEVFKARVKQNTKKFVAMKKVLMNNQREGFPITALREVKILKLLNHENVINLIEICHSKGTAANGFKPTYYLVFDFCDHDLAGLLANVNVKFTLAEIKKVMQMMLNGLYYIHSNLILHRDMKAANILITKQGILKLADFGLARAFSVPQNDVKNRYTNRVVTLWYRPPELLLGERNYGPAVDMWGAGCIMAEMWTKSPILQGRCEQQQLKLISQLCGSLTPAVWPGVQELELFKSTELTRSDRRQIKKKLAPYVKDQNGCDLIDKMLVLDPQERINADKALNHDFFWTDPLPCALTRMLSQLSQSMFEYSSQQRRRHVAQHQQLPIIKPNSEDECTVKDRIW